MRKQAAEGGATQRSRGQTAARRAARARSGGRRMVVPPRRFSKRPRRTVTLCWRETRLCRPRQRARAAVDCARPAYGALRSAPLYL